MEEFTTKRNHNKGNVALTIIEMFYTLGVERFTLSGVEGSPRGEQKWKSNL
jgi:hypothetical protein|tara:strand:- start:743 stop:895 length:153 start_codon:yes stop_codon:yes gene_type:complete